MKVSATKRKSNKENAKKSTGPRTTAGKQAVRYNAVKHGATSPNLLPWEKPELFQERLIGHKNSVHPVTPLEHELCEQLTMSSWQRERALQSEVARVTRNIHTSHAEERRNSEQEVAALGQRLFYDQHGPLPLHPRGEYDAEEPRTVWSKTPDDANHPSRLVMSLESTWAGVRFLLARWRELRDRLESGDCWHAPRRSNACGCWASSRMIQPTTVS